MTLPIVAITGCDYTLNFFWLDQQHRHQFTDSFFNVAALCLKQLTTALAAVLVISNTQQKQGSEPCTAPRVSFRI